jgi:hypothetical protein
MEGYRSVRGMRDGAPNGEKNLRGKKMRWTDKVKLEE